MPLPRLLFIQWLRNGPKCGCWRELLLSGRFYWVCFVIRRALRGVIRSSKIRACRSIMADDGVSRWRDRVFYRIFRISRTTIVTNGSSNRKFKNSDSTGMTEPKLTKYKTIRRECIVSFFLRQYTFAMKTLLYFFLPIAYGFYRIHICY